MTRKTTHEPCSLDQDCWLNDRHEGPHAYAASQPTPEEERDAVLAERLDWEAARSGDGHLALVRTALTDEDEIAHGEAVGPNGGTGQCAYCDDVWPCHTQRAIDRLLARIGGPGSAYADAQARWQAAADLPRLRDQVIVAARELVVSFILQPAGLVGRHRERFEDLRQALIAMGPDAAIARAQERAEARGHAPRCVCGHALSSHRQDAVDPYISQRCIYCRCAAFDNRDDAKMQGDDE